METSEKLKIGKELQSRPDLVQYIKEISWSLICANVKFYGNGTSIPRDIVDHAIDEVVATDNVEDND